MRTVRLFVVVVSLSALTFFASGDRAGAAGSNISGTVKAAGLSSNADAVVYLQEAPAGKPPGAVTMDQKKMQFMPHVLPVMIGTTVNRSPTIP